MAANLKDDGPGAMKIKNFGWLKTSLNKLEVDNAK
jgi:hypothetical protein